MRPLIYSRPLESDACVKLKPAQFFNARVKVKPARFSPLLSFHLNPIYLSCSRNKQSLHSCTLHKSTQPLLKSIADHSFRHQAERPEKMQGLAKLREKFGYISSPCGNPDDHAIKATVVISLKSGCSKPGKKTTFRVYSSTHVDNSTLFQSFRDLLLLNSGNNWKLVLVSLLYML